MNEDVLITSLNDDSLSFKVKSQKYFENDTLKDVQQMLNIKFTSQQTQPTCDTKAIDSVETPEMYNFYEKHSDCKHDMEM